MVKAKTGKSIIVRGSTPIKEGVVVCSADMTMERSTSKELSGREHLERTDYIIAKQKEKAEKAQAIKQQAIICLRTVSPF